MYVLLGRAPPFPVILPPLGEWPLTRGGTALIARRRGGRDSGARLEPRCGRSHDQAVLSGLHFRFAPRQATLGWWGRLTVCCASVVLGCWSGGPTDHGLPSRRCAHGRCLSRAFAFGNSRKRDSPIGEVALWRCTLSVGGVNALRAHCDPALERDLTSPRAERQKPPWRLINRSDALSPPPRPHQPVGSGRRRAAPRVLATRRS